MWTIGRKIQIFGFVTILLIPSEEAFAKILLKINYTLDLTSNSGKVQVAEEVDFIMNGKEVEAYHKDNGQDVLIAKRSTGRGDYYGPGIFSTRIEGGKLILSGTGKTHTVNVTVSTDGKTTCSASAEFHLNPGSILYELVVPNYGRVYGTNAQIDSLVCTLSVQ
jgi:hypothetical protein